MIRGIIMVIVLAIYPAYAVTQLDAVNLVADPRVRAALEAATRCTIQRAADYINAGSQESADALGRAAVQYCFRLWVLAPFHSMT